MGSGQVPNVANVRIDIIEIKRTVTKLSTRLVIDDPVIENMILTVVESIIWEESIDVQAEQIKE